MQRDGQNRKRHVAWFRRTAFSLAEMMIALAILAFGLLVIGASLPIGLRYNQESFDLNAGEAAAEHMQAIVATQTRLVGVEPGIREPDNPDYTGRRYGDVARPRWARIDPLSPPLNAGRVIWHYEPIIKVRPFPAQLFNARAGANPAGPFEPGVDPGRLLLRSIDLQINGWGARTVQGWGTALDGLEFDLARTSPVFSALSTVYPPVSRTLPYTIEDFRSAPAYTPSTVGPTEMRKVRETGVVTVSFYRRVSYDFPERNRTRPSPFDPDRPATIRPELFVNDDLCRKAMRRTDASLYEVITVSIRVPGPDYAFPAYDPTDQSYMGIDTQVPMPLLVEFANFDPAQWPPPAIVPSDTLFTVPFNLDREVQIPNAADSRPTITFQASGGVAQFLPPGSIFIPAVNDEAPTFWNNTTITAGQHPSPLFNLGRRAGLVPHSPESLPIYKVVDRVPNGTNFDIVVENQGIYPWVFGANQSINWSNWPVWVIPPAFKERAGNGTPIFEDRSTILSVARRTIRLPEVETPFPGAPQ